MSKGFPTHNITANLPLKWKFLLLVVPSLLLMGFANITAVDRLLTANETFSQFHQHFLAITLVISLLGIAIQLLIIRLITKPLTDLALTTAKLDGEKPGAGEGDEISQLARSVNRMTSGLRDSQSNRVTAEQSCREGEALYRSLLDNIDLGITLISKDFEVIFLNAAHGRMFNRSPESFRGRKCYREFRKREVPCPDDCPGRKAMQSGKAEEVEVNGTRDDGTAINVRIKAFPLRNKNQEITGFVEIVTDISSQRTMEEELRRIRSIESIGILAGGLAHDFNNLLTTIIGNIDLAKIGADPNQDFVIRLNAAEKACEQARRLTNQLLTFAKGGQPVKKEVQLSQILDEACHFTLSGSSLRYILDAPTTLWPVEIDPSQMSQVIHHLLNNASESLVANPTGKIFVVAENVELDASSSLPLPPGPYVKVAVVDEGRGISPDIINTIFNPYFTTKEMGAAKGTGLGLAICHSIIHRHGGHISVESQAGQGATFTIYLPAMSKQPIRQHHLGGETEPPYSGPSRNILILEDEEAVAHITASFLASLHHHSEIAGTGAEALKLFQQAQAKGNPFDMLILDLTIRGGMGGEELLQKVRAIAPNVPAIVTSGYTENPIMVSPQDHGFEAALAKPFNQAALRAAISGATTKLPENQPPAPPASATPPPD